MIILYVIAGFFMTIISIGFGIMIGYPLGNKNDRSLKQQITRLKQTVKKHNRSAQLKALTTAELKERDDWDFRTRLAEVSGADVTTPDTPKDDDPNSIGNTF